ncbi:hypothetical protein niasHT_006593 [Heterodera trifolii]|uniref:Uncharacterized protein n=1 Tax=Heterodera trifolii TaxID=157864 RepID=A0ABD2M7R1_9BILA
MMLMSNQVVEEYREAFHEAWHAAACKFNKHCPRVIFLSILHGVDENGRAYRGSTKVAERVLFNKDQLLAQMQYFLSVTLRRAPEFIARVQRYLNEALHYLEAEFAKEAVKKIVREVRFEPIE